MIRAVRDDIDAKTMSSLVLILRSYNGFLGMSRSESFISYMGAGLMPGSHKEVEKRRQQMDDLLKEQEYIVSQEIRQAIHTINAKSKLVGFSKANIKEAQAKLKDLEEKKERGIFSVPGHFPTQRLISGREPVGIDPGSDGLAHCPRQIETGAGPAFVPVRLHSRASLEDAQPTLHPILSDAAIVASFRNRARI